MQCLDSSLIITIHIPHPSQCAIGLALIPISQTNLHVEQKYLPNFYPQDVHVLHGGYSKSQVWHLNSFVSKRGIM